MPIVIERVEEGYTARVAPPHGCTEWVSPRPLPADELARELVALGCHQTDIGDAFAAADPGWLDHVS
jgi:hypothetical protein